MEKETQKWTTVIRPHTGWFDINIKEVWDYRDLIMLFVKRFWGSIYVMLFFLNNHVYSLQNISVYMVHAIVYFSVMGFCVC